MRAGGCRACACPLSVSWAAYSSAWTRVVLGGELTCKKGTSRRMKNKCKYTEHERFFLKICTVINLQASSFPAWRRLSAFLHVCLFFLSGSCHRPTRSQRRATPTTTTIVKTSCALFPCCKVFVFGTWYFCAYFWGDFGAGFSW